MSAIDRDWVGSDFLQKAGNIEAGRRAQDVLRALPSHFFEPVKSRFFRESDERGQVAANSYISQVKAELCSSALSLSSSDSEICEFAVMRSNEVRSMLMAMTATTAADMRATLAGYCFEFGAVVTPGCLLAGLTARMTDVGWWRRQVRRSMARKVEAHAIGLGFVHRKSGLYASDEAVKRHGEQCARNIKALEATQATNEEGLTMTLAELSAVGTSNPALRRMELMTRISGFEGCAKAAGHVGMFYTATAPSRMHARLSKTGQENPKFDGTTPKECAAYMSKTWAKARAWLHRRGINIYGFRVAEPHHDGTPHWHMLFFMLADAVESVTYCLRRYFCENDAHELEASRAMDARFNAKEIDWSRGSAAGYISKYIAKNIDGKRNDLSAAGDDFEAAGSVPASETAPRVLAWASTWGIRQFQQIGGPGVTVWRELRRVRDAVQGDLFDTWSAADAGNWQAFTDRQGGAICKRKDRPVQLWKEVEEGKRTKYAEEAGPQIKGVFMNRPTAGESALKTRIHTWEIRKCSESISHYLLPSQRKQSRTNAITKSAKNMAPIGGRGTCDMSNTLADAGTCGGQSRYGFDLGRLAGPWSPVNNCTPSEKDADGFEVGGFAGQASPPEISAAMREKIKAAEIAAVLDGIRAKRQRGAFGQFPKLGFSTRPGGQNARSN